MIKFKPLIAALALLIGAGIALAATGHLKRNSLDAYGMSLVSRLGGPGYDKAMLKLTEIWNTDDFLKASIPIVAHGNDRAYGWLESSMKAMLISEAVVTPLKYIVNRRRPDGEHSRANASFPSSHASSAFAFAATYAGHYPRQGAKAFEVAVFVGVSRIWLERHYPSDVLAGAAIGLGAAMLSEIYLFWLHFDRDILFGVLLMATGADQDGPTERSSFGKGERPQPDRGVTP
jgi:membrane-associated phospholipid phosphatase